VLEFLTGTGLAVAAGLNAYVPLLALGLAGKFLTFVSLPAGWNWLSNDWVLGIIAVLLVIEIVADKIPVVDSINDWVQAVVRPASGGIVFGTGAASETLAVADPASFFSGSQWIPIATGIAMALGVHVAKSSVRPLLNSLTGGIAAPVASSLEDLGSVLLSVLALLLPILVVAVIAVSVVTLVLAVRRMLRSETS